MPTSCKYSKHTYQIQLVILQNVFSSLKNLLSYIWFYFLLVKFHIQFQSAIFLLQIAYHENERDIMYQTFSSKMVSIYLFLRRHFLKIQKMILIQKGRFSKKKREKTTDNGRSLRRKVFNKRFTQTYPKIFVKLIVRQVFLQFFGTYSFCAPFVPRCSQSSGRLNEVPLSATFVHILSVK